MKTNLILACLKGMLACLLLLAGCTKYDDSALWEKVNTHEQRIAALETWSATVNTNITALQNLVNAMEEGDYVTGITPLVENNVETGYIITFHTGDPITIYHGKKGDKGDTGSDGTDGVDGIDGQAPVIGVKRHTDQKLYWTIDGAWLLDEAGSMIPVTGANGKDGIDGTNGADAVAPQIRINTGTNEWEISIDNGETWTSTGVKATGEKGQDGADGEKGQDGDAIFVKNGIDNSHADYVVFTLVGGETITLPKYKDLDISFTQPGVFFAGETKIVAYSLTGSVTIVKVVDIPEGWTVSVNKVDHTFTITAPAALPEFVAQRETEALVLVSDGADRTLLRTLSLTVLSQMTMTIENNDKISIHVGGIGVATIDWGDGTIQNYALGSATQISHDYATTADYTITITGGYITFFSCFDNDLITSLDVSKNTALTTLYCGSNQLTSLDVSGCAALIQLTCSSNQLTTTALNALFGTLHNNTIASHTKTIRIGNNPGTGTCDQSIAIAKGWTVYTNQ